MPASDECTPTGSFDRRSVQPHFSVNPMSPGMPPEKSTTLTRILYPSGRRCRSQN